MRQAKTTIFLYVYYRLTLKEPFLYYQSNQVLRLTSILYIYYKNLKFIIIYYAFWDPQK